MPDPEFWKGHRVLVTGHTGFKGSWLALWLLQMGAEVAGYALPPRTPADNFVVCGLKSRMYSSIGDIRDFAGLEHLFAEFRPETVFHLAAQPLVRHSYREPKETFDVNLGGTVNLLECCRRNDCVRSIVVITSDKCYENREMERGYREDDPLGGTDPYSASKAGAEIIATAYRRSFFNPDNFSRHGKALASARAGNVIGGGDWQTDRLIPDCIRALQERKTITIRNPRATRPWQHVLEPLAGYLRLAEKLAAAPARFSGAWNFGPAPEDCREVAWIVRQIVRLWGNGTWQVTGDSEQLHEAGRLHLDNRKAVSELGWQPAWDLAVGLEKTVAWYRGFQRQPEKIKKVTLEQIMEYQQVIRRKSTTG